MGALTTYRRSKVSKYALSIVTVAAIAAFLQMDKKQYLAIEIMDQEDLSLELWIHQPRDSGGTGGAHGAWARGFCLARIFVERGIR